MRASADRVSTCRRSFVAASIEFPAFFFVALLASLLSFGGAYAQPAPQNIKSVIGFGNGVVTGFSGVVPPSGPLPAGVTPANRTFINLKGASARVFDLQNMGGTPSGQHVNAPKPFTATASQIGQVFGVALDDALPPNIYVTATSAYGLPIVLPDSDGDGRPERARLGTPNATFMPGLWGPATQGGGPGSVWKIDGVTGTVSLFANVALDGTPNSGPALGGIVFDRLHEQLIVADRDTGMIHRFSLDGVDRGRYDHGVTGRGAAGLPPVPFNPANRLDITSPAFNTENPATWQVAPAERLISGLGINGSRLYYAVSEGPQIWSVSILNDGSFGEDAVLEIEVPPALAATEIVKISFDDRGRMILGERGVTVGAYDFNVLAQESVSRALRYGKIVPAPGEPPVWQPEPDEYAIGYAVQNRNANGGVAVGFGYGSNGRIDLRSCSGTLWTTGEQLRQSADAATAKELAVGGPAEVNGLQGNTFDLSLPEHFAPAQSYFIDYDGQFGNANALGHMGDIAIWRLCGTDTGWLAPGYWPPEYWTPPPPPPPAPGPDQNLRIDKWATPGLCVPWFGGWRCDYTVRVTSTGPSPYAGPILLSDWLPSNPPGAGMAFGGDPNWTCGGPLPAGEFWCDYPPVVLAPGAFVELQVSAWVPNAYPHCTLTNAARIDWLPGGGDATPFDDFAAATAGIPAKHCPIKGDKANLRMEKESLGCADLGGGTHQCSYLLTITNTGPGIYNDHIHFTDQIPAGTSANFFSNPANPFVCAGGPPNYSCQSTNPHTLNPWEFVNTVVQVDIPNARAKALMCQAPNDGAITQAPGGSPQNTNPGDDTDTAIAIMPGALCDIQDTNLQLTKTFDQCAPAGGGNWQCDFTVTVTNTGPGGYSEVTQIEDALFAHPAAAVSTITPPAGFVCNLINPASQHIRCTSPGAVLAASASMDFSVSVVVPTPAAVNQCQFVNAAAIQQAAPGTPKNNIAGDDTAFAFAVVPAPICLAAQTNLTIEKELFGADCVPFGGGWRCPWVVTLRNTGANNYAGPVQIRDRITAMPPGGTLTAVIPGDAAYACVAGPGADEFTCTKGAEALAPAALKQFGVLVDLPTPANPVPAECVVTNEAEIITLPGGSLMNIVIPDDLADSTVVLPDPMCAGVSPAAPPPDCEPGEILDRRNNQCVPLPIHDKASSGRACPSGTRHDTRNSRCVTPPPPACPPGTAHSRSTSRCVLVPPPPPPPSCPPGTLHNTRTSACAKVVPVCPPGQWHSTRTSRCERVTPVCPPGSLHSRQTSACIKVVPVCPKGQRHSARTSRCEPVIPDCPRGQRHNRKSSKCEPIIPDCPRGQRHNSKTSKCEPIVPSCPSGQRHNAKTSRCEPIVPACPTGQRHNSKTSKCERIIPTCPPGQRHNAQNSRCTPIVIQPTCKPGQTHIRSNSRCVTIDRPKAPTCPTGQRHNTKTSKCEPIVPTCPRGQRHNPQDSRCVPIVIRPPTQQIDPKVLQQQQPTIR